MALEGTETMMMKTTTRRTRAAQCLETTSTQTARATPAQIAAGYTGDQLENPLSRLQLLDQELGRAPAPAALLPFSLRFELPSVRKVSEGDRTGCSAPRHGYR